jgi:hypothetical protein
MDVIITKCKALHFPEQEEAAVLLPDEPPTVVLAPEQLRVHESGKTRQAKTLSNSESQNEQQLKRGQYNTLASWQVTESSP